METRDIEKTGKVYIVGAGPGDPGLITVKGLTLLREADVIVYDHLVNTVLLNHAKESALLIYAGKEGGAHTLSQDEINDRLVQEAREGKLVIRLKGGDPFIFGRGGEEAVFLSHAGIPFEIVPGVTSAIAAPAYAGIPLTHRHYASTVAFVTGHEDPKKADSDIDWKAAAGMGTLVFLMGVKNLPAIVDNLIRHGKDPSTPAAIVRWGTTEEQRTLTGTLSDIAGKAEGAHISPPAILVVGKVVALRDTLNWFETKPLFGKGVVITRPEMQAEAFASLLRLQGARVIHFPTITIVPPESFENLDRAIDQLSHYHWIIFTSANAVNFFLQRLWDTGRDMRELKGIRTCCIGPATAATLMSLGIRVDLMPEEYISEGVVRAFATQEIKGQRVLLPRAEKARDVIPHGLAELGAKVDVVTAYRTIRSDRRKSELDTLIQEKKVDVITFTSPSTVTHFVAIMGEEYSLPPHIIIACIGPITASTAEKAGFTVHIVQERYTIPGLVDALVNYFSQKSAG